MQLIASDFWLGRGLYLPLYAIILLVYVVMPTPELIILFYFS